MAQDYIKAAIVFSIFSLSGYYAAFFNNAFLRLNREYGSDIDTAKIKFEAKFNKNDDVTATSAVLLWAKALETQKWDIRKYHFF